MKSFKMRFLLFTICFLISIISISQNIVNVKDLKPDQEYDNILVKKLDTDSNSTSFIIWVKKGVKAHKHENHSEVLYVLNGEGKMTIGDSTSIIKTGDYFRIPKNTFHSLEVISDEAIKVISVQAPEFFGKDRIFKED